MNAPQQRGGQAEALSIFDAAIERELPRVSHVHYDSHEICKHFAGEVRKQIEALTSAPPAPSADDPWRSLFNEVARLVKCLPSSFPDANDHVLRAIKTLAESAPSQGASMPQYWSVTVTMDGQDIVSIGHDWLSGNRPLEERDEQTIIGAAQHLLSFVGYGLPPSRFDPDAPSVGGWISVEDRLPDACFKEVLVYPRPSDYCCEAYWNGERWEYGEYVQHVGNETHPCTVTHWMERPQPPKEKP